MSLPLITSFPIRALLPFLLFPLLASAGDWMVPGSACAPDYKSAGKYTADWGGSVYLKNGETIRLICTVSNPNDAGNPGWRSMQVRFYDGDGPGGKRDVQVRLYRLELSSGAVRAEIVGLLESALFPQGSQTRAVRLTEAIDFSRFRYYVVTTLTSTDENGNAALHHIRLY
jgi:hypothetical protein